MKSSRKHMIGLSMRTSLTLCVLAALIALSSCGSETFTPEAKRADAIEKFKLTPAQTDIMDAYFEGMTKKSPEGKFTRRWTQIAACYAARINIEPRYDVVHRDYIRDFEAVEKDYYPWFQRRGVSDDASYELGNKVKTASDFCHNTIRR
ncbi:MAG: hypothetical protein EX271_09285 [Acidimicrobiales bacterium]|nr:hypothetical protein [Hyphomonadaceae bacterium]RZV40871.1 MAG: hypothetical protein EX271_09285 [Acidimicrobiales bacterium]